MNTHADKTQENKSQSVANASPQKSSGESTFQFVDNRPEAIAQRKLQEIANNYTPKQSSKSKDSLIQFTRSQGEDIPPLPAMIFIKSSALKHGHGESEIKIQIIQNWKNRHKAENGSYSVPWGGPDASVAWNVKPPFLEVFHAQSYENMQKSKDNSSLKGQSLGNALGNWRK